MGVSVTEPAPCLHKRIDRHWATGAPTVLDICLTCQAYRVIPENQSWVASDEGWRRRDGRPA